MQFLTARTQKESAPRTAEVCEGARTKYSGKIGNKKSQDGTLPSGKTTDVVFLQAGLAVFAPTPTAFFVNYFFARRGRSDRVILAGRAGGGGMRGSENEV